MDDPRDLVLVEHPLERVELGDVAADERHAGRVVSEHEVEPRRVLAEVVADDVVAVCEHRARDPCAQAAEDAGDEDPFAHERGASWYTVTASVKNSSAARPCSCGP